MKIPSYIRQKSPVLLVAGLGGLFTVVNLAFAQGWTKTSPPGPVWQTVTASADGSKIVAAGRIKTVSWFGVLYTSTDAGMTWVQTTADKTWTSVASSADGTKLVAVDRGTIYTSLNSGATWTQTSSPSDNIWTSVASSADGAKVVAVGWRTYDFNTQEYIGGQIYTSSDSGATWTQASAPSNSWSSVASSADGNKLVAGASSGTNANQGLIYTSTNSGATWTQASAPSNYWSSVASSADGAKVVAVGWRSYDFNTQEYIGGQIYTSSDSGATWTQSSAPSNYWLSVASSADGTKLVAVGDGTYDSNTGDYLGSPIYTSSDSGATWRQSSAPSNYWSSVASSADGSKLVAAAPDGIYISPIPWRLTSAPSYSWTSVASSADGTKLVVVVDRTYDINTGGYLGGPIYTSPDSGATWTHTTAPTHFWSSVASSADGTKLVAAAMGYEAPGNEIEGPIYTSPDSGATWKPTTAPAKYWLSVAISADGTKLVAANADQIYTSADSGATWAKSSAPSSQLWIAVASSADGTKLVAVASSAKNGNRGLIYTSTNSGATWTQTSAPSNSWLSVASSADGSKLVASGMGLIYTSADSGATWTKSSAPLSSVVASSADGTKLVAITMSDDSGNSGLISSTDSGATWTQTFAPGELWNAVASSADGSKLVAVANGSPIYTLQFPLPNPRSPRLAISPSGASLGLSWIVPSTSFVLQQNFDLSPTNWTDVLTAPTLNFTNLHYQVTVSQSLGSRFYRLKQQ